GAKIVVLGTPGASGSWFHRMATTPEPGTRVVWLKDPLTNPSVSESFVRGELRRLEARGPFGRLLARRLWGAEVVDVRQPPFLDPGWVEGAGSASIEPYHPAVDVTFLAGDLSITHDKTSLVVLGRRGRACRVLEAVVIDPRAASGGRVPLGQVERRIEVL